MSLKDVCFNEEKSAHTLSCILIWKTEAEAAACRRPAPAATRSLPRAELSAESQLTVRLPELTSLLSHGPRVAGRR